jgi:hypothetical protein
MKMDPVGISIVCPTSNEENLDGQFILINVGIFVGIFREYMGRIYREAKRHPPYIVEKKY